MSRFFNKEHERLDPYTPGEQPQNKDLIKLNTNENPYGPSPKVLEAITGKEIDKLMLYPDPEAKQLVQAISDYYQIDEKQVITGNGSDEILAFCFMAFQREDKRIFFPQISYGFYPVYGELFQTNWSGIPLSADFRIDVEKYKNLKGNIVIANPNAPTGIALQPSEIEAIIKSNRDNLVIVDEAYADFGTKSSVRFIEKYDNLLVVQTFSKSRSLAGGRVGFAMGNSALISDLNRIKFSFNPYNLNYLSILAATAAIEDKAYFESTRNRIIKTREWLMKKMKDLGFSILPSSANFIFCRHNRLSGKEYFSKLRQENILVRHFDKEPISDFVRITIGKEEDMQILLETTETLLREV